MAITSATSAPPDEPPAAVGAPAQSHPSLRAAIVRLLAVIFLILLFVPLLGAFLHWDPTSASNENRRLAERPHLPTDLKDAGKYSDRWLSFYRDHFGLRNTLIHGVAKARINGLGDDTDGNVVVGKDGWLFLRPDGDRNFIAFRGLNPLSDDELTAWQNLLERRNAWLTAHGIPYLVVIPPDKQTIYPEFLPPEYAPVRHVSRLDQFVNRLKETHSPVHFLDLRPALLAAKPTGRLYHKTDTHWNDSGAFVGYSVIINAAKELLPQWNIIPQTQADFTHGPIDAEIGDLSRMMDMPDQYPDEGFGLMRKIPFPIPKALSDRNAVAVMDQNNPKLPRLVFYRDSFGIALVPMLGPNFGRVVYAFHYEMDPEMIASEKPDLAITEFIERNLYLSAPPTDPPEVRNITLR